jgi:hypothetical protein
MASGDGPVFMSDTTCEALVAPTVVAGKVSASGESATVGAPETSPVPDNGTICGLPDASSVTASWPTRPPLAIGVNVTLKVHEALAASVDPHVVAYAKSPEIDVEAMFSVPVPLLVSVTDCPALVVPTVCGAKVSDAGANETAGTGAAVPLPVSAMESGLVAAFEAKLADPANTPGADGVKKKS